MKQEPCERVREAETFEQYMNHNKELCIVMAKEFSSQQAKMLVNVHEKLYKDLSAAVLTQDGITSGIITAADQIIEKELQKLLQNIPVEEINRDKLGIKTKPLKDDGYETIGDVRSATVQELEAVNGISLTGAGVIKKIADDFAAEAVKDAKIRLSYDQQTAETGLLIKYIAVYLKTRSFYQTGGMLLKEYGPDVQKAVEDVRCATSGIRWIFTFRNKKEQAEKAYRWLYEAKNGDYGQQAQKVLKGILSGLRITEKEAWEDFKEHSIDYITVLEELKPGCLGKDDQLYGLPEDLAKEISEQEIFPDGLLCTLRRYQEWGVKYALHQEKVLLGDEMGLGKTVQAIATMVSLKNTGATHFLVVCPASVISNWCREITKHSKLTVTKIHGPGRQSQIASWIVDGGVGVTTFETTAFFFLDDEFHYDMLIVDEAHYIKNPSAKRSKNVKRLSSHTDRLLFMTGTALENNVDEMLSIMEVLNPEVARDADHIAFLSSAPQFREKIAPVYYRRKREDVLTELPEKIETKEWCHMTNEERKIYERDVLLKRYADVRRVSWNVPDIRESSKGMRLLELVEEARADGRKVIVFSFYLDTIRTVTKLLGNCCMTPINGSVSPQKRQEIIDEFDKAPAGTVLPAQIMAGGTGLNIQSASVVILCEPQFKPSIENQAISRAYRMGQARNVLVYRLLCEDTVDEKIMDVLAEKQGIFDAFADTSVAAAESLELDDKTFGKIIEEEIERIKKQNKEITEVIYVDVISENTALADVAAVFERWGENDTEEDTEIE